MISFRCASCGLDIKVKDDLASKRGKCPKCQQPVTVPTAASQASATVAPPAADQPDAPTLLPAAAGDREPETISLQVRSAAVHTNHGGLAVPSGIKPEHYDILAPAEGPDELGRLGGYRILAVLGAGGMGVVFQAEDPTLKRKVALKAMLPTLAASESARQRFLREAQTAATIEHDHIVRIFQVGEDRGVPFLVMPLLKGQSLEDRLLRDRKLPVAEVLRIGREAAKGLAAAHAAGLVHRDVKPANLWLEGEEGRVKVLDFGLARAAADNANLTQQGAIIGTPAYMAPEQARGGKVDPRSDLFSLGCVLYRMSTGEQPFKGTDAVSTLMAVVTVRPPAPCEVSPQVPEAVSDLIMELLEKKVSRRPASAQVVLEAIRTIEDGVTLVGVDGGSGACGAGAARIKVKKGSRRRSRRAGAWLFSGPGLALLCGVAGLALAGAIVAGVLLFRTGHGTLIVKASEPGMQVLVDGEEKLVIDSTMVGRIELRPGEHRLRLRRGREEVYAETFTLPRGGEVVIDSSVQVVAVKPAAPPASRPVKPSTPPTSAAALPSAPRTVPDRPKEPPTSAPRLPPTPPTGVAGPVAPAPTGTSPAVIRRITFTYTEAGGGKGTFKNTVPGAWIENGPKGERYGFREVKRTADFIQIYDPNRMVSVRIFSHKYMYARRNGPWIDQSKGLWTE